ncbi:MAG: exodeoxyribonuclease III [Hyphomicrobiales bacterium]|nr:exodeoxyribonuclease III [Hyphomicrobiales bacterium]MDE2018413.1 exodeoxyribonuclease III [Hyphomicrobiales bacterium]
MRISTWNVNSVRQRISHLLEFLREEAPDVVCLQEIKCLDDAFPRAEVEEAGYTVATHGQKTFNGVAILSKLPMEVERGLPGDPDDAQARYIEAAISVPRGIVRVASVYAPNGNPVATEKYAYKLAFMERLERHARKLLALEEPFALAGDFNVIPEERDAKDFSRWRDDALGLPATRAAWRRLLNLGLVDALRATTDAAGIYTFWDYQAGAFQRDDGIRIDHALLSPQAADLLGGARVARAMRAREKPSDHVPLIVDLAT